HDGEAVLAVGVPAQLVAILLEGLGERRRRRDRIPGAECGAAINGAERRGLVAFDEDAIADLVGALQLQTNRREMILGEIEPELERLQVRRDQLILALELLA